MGYFHALKIAFLSSLQGNTCSKRASITILALKRHRLLSDALKWRQPPGPPQGDAAPWTPQVPPLTIYPGAAHATRVIVMVNITTVFELTGVV